jgi:hypothetical protein
MISMNDFNNIFIERHDFQYDDLEFLPSKYTNIRFIDIPEAWVVLIDMCLEKIQQLISIKSISQVMGHLSIEAIYLSDEDKVTLKRLEDMVKQLDIDLHGQISEGIVLH